MTRSLSIQTHFHVHNKHTHTHQSITLNCNNFFILHPTIFILCCFGFYLFTFSLHNIPFRMGAFHLFFNMKTIPASIRLQFDFNSFPFVLLLNALCVCVFFHRREFLFIAYSFTTRWHQFFSVIVTIAAFDDSRYIEDNINILITSPSINWNKL